MKYKFSRVEFSSKEGVFFADVTELSDSVPEVRTADVYIAGKKIHSVGDPVTDEFGNPVMTAPEAIALYNDAIVDTASGSPVAEALKDWFAAGYPNAAIPQRVIMEECYVIEPDTAWHCVVRPADVSEEPVVYILRLDDPYMDEAVRRSFFDWRDVQGKEIPEWEEPPLAHENYPSLHRTQFLKGMRRLGVTKDMVVGVIEKVPDEDAKADLMIDWEESQVFVRTSQLIKAISSDPDIGITEKRLDEAWLEAAKL